MARLGVTPPRGPNDGEDEEDEEDGGDEDDDREPAVILAALLDPTRAMRAGA
jgi:hypothetical protein